MKRGKTLSLSLAVVAVAVGLLGWSGGGLAEGADLRPGTWTGGAGLGFLGNTPDGTAFALNLNGEVFVIPNLSVGPLLQLGFTGHSSQVGLSGQVKYWIDIPGTGKRLRVTPQAGLGFVHNSFREGDTSWLIPIGAGADYALSDRLAVTGTLLINFTNLDTGRGSGADVMPGFTVGVRF
jgi:hypothetical protein